MEFKQASVWNHLVSSILTLSNDKLMSGSHDETIRIWDKNSYECLNILENESLFFSLC